MKVTKVNNNSFYAKPKYVNTKQLNALRELSEKMNGEFSYTENVDTYKKSFISSLKLGSILFSNDFNCSKHEDPFSMYLGDSSIEFNNKKIRVNNETGEILEIKKPFFTSVKKVLRQMEDYLDILSAHFDNGSVERIMAEVTGFTDIGKSKLMGLLPDDQIKIGE